MVNNEKLQDDLSSVVEEVNQEIAETVQEIETAETVKAVEEVVETVAEAVEETTEPFKVFNTEHDLNEALRSASSKAKDEILKELGVDSINEFKDKHEKVEDYIKLSDELETIQSNLTSVLEEKTRLEEIVLQSKFPMDEKASKLFVDLVNQKRDGRDLLEVAEEVYTTLKDGLKSYPTKVVFGSEKTAEKAEITNNALTAFEKGLGI